MQTTYIQTLTQIINILSVMHFKYPVQCTINQVIQFIYIRFSEWQSLTCICKIWDTVGLGLQ